MADAWHAIKISEFEYVEVSSSTTLLRVAGKGPRRGGGGPRPVMVVRDGDAVHRATALPAPPDARGMLRAAYPVAAGAISPMSSFSLLCSDGREVSLPEPTEGVARPAGRSESRAPVTPPPVPAPESAADDGDDGERLAAAHRRIAELESDAQRATASLQELETWRGELERSLTAATDELNELRLARRADAAEIERLRSELEQRRVPEPALTPEPAHAPTPVSAPTPSLDADAQLEAIRQAALAEAEAVAQRELDEA